MQIFLLSEVILSRLFLLFAVVPFMELYVLIQVGGELGIIPTIALVIFTAAVGAWLARSQGLDVLARIQAETAAGHTPTDALLDGACILFAGMLLLTPGFLTDGLGLMLLFPPTRMAIRGWLGKSMASTFASRSHGGFGGAHFGGAHFGGQGGHGQHDAYDTTFTSTGPNGASASSNNAQSTAQGDYHGGADTTVYQGSEAQRGPFGNGMRVVMHTMTIGPDGQRVSSTRTYGQGGQSGQTGQGNPFQGTMFDSEHMGDSSDTQAPRKTVIIDSKPIDGPK